MTTSITTATEQSLGTFPLPGEIADGGSTMVGHVFLPELRRTGQATRANQGYVQVGITALSWSPVTRMAKPGNVISDSTVLLGFDAPEGDGLNEGHWSYAPRLTSGEARCLAALLVRAADALDTDEGHLGEYAPEARVGAVR